MLTSEKSRLRKLRGGQAMGNVLTCRMEKENVATTIKKKKGNDNKTVQALLRLYINL